MVTLSVVIARATDLYMRIATEKLSGTIEIGVELLKKRGVSTARALRRL
jgi:hypothetical protein